ncbi:MAG: DUF2339 domain-containing protein, partial [Flavobacteriales bacterium]|nr:DUF2339 domain-containing protein [Flavobacteriales bacterium]
HLDMVLFTSAFFAVFVAETVIYNLRFNKKFTAFDFSILLAINGVTFGAAMGLLHYIDQGMWQGLFTALIAFVNLALAVVLFRKKGTDKKLIYLVLGLALTFVSLIAPIQMEGSHITIFWASEAVLLLWFSIRTKMKLVRWSAVGVYVLMFISLFMDWADLYIGAGIENNPLALLMNKGFITNAFCTIALAGSLLFVQDQRPFTRVFRLTLQIALGIMIYLTGLFEINYQTDQLIDHSYGAKSLVVGVYNFAAILIAYLVTRKRRGVVRIVMGSLGIVGLIGYLTYYQPMIREVVNAMVIDGAPAWAFNMHYLALVLVLIVPLHLANRFFKKSWVEPWKTLSVWGGTLLLLFTVSVEFDHAAVAIGYDPGESIAQLLHKSRKAGYAISWGVSAFVLMGLGLRHRMRMLRIAALSVFGAVLFKLFLLDIREMPEGGRIEAFIGLGILLLVI